MAQQTQINGNRYSFTSITVEMAGIAQAKGTFRSINYSAKQDPGIVQGNQVTIVGLTSGYGQGDGSVEMLVSEMDDFFSAISQNGQIPIMNVDFDIVVSYSENNVDVRTDTLRGCRITSIDSNNTQGTDASTKTCNLVIRRIWLNGLSAFADPQPQA